METLAATLIIILSATEAYCLWRIKNYVKERSEQRSEARRAASRPRAYKKVHDSWTVYRNRRQLWESINKEV